MPPKKMLCTDPVLVWVWIGYENSIDNFSLGPQQRILVLIDLNRECSEFSDHIKPFYGVFFSSETFFSSNVYVE